MAAVTAPTISRRRSVNERELQQSGFTCALAQTGATVCARVLWEDDRYGRVSELVELPTQQRRLQVELPAGRTVTGNAQWVPLEHLTGANSETMARLLTLIGELAGDIHARTAPLRDIESFEIDESVQYQGLV